jgi:phytoene synthase
MDVSPRRYETYAELDLYCYRVAGTVGLLLAPVLGCRSAAALGPAADLGRAMQLTNILRDIAEDHLRGRCYLPLEELAACGLNEFDLARRQVDDRFVALMQRQIARARTLYHQAAAGVPYLSGFGSQRLVRLMGAIYGGILSEIEAQQYDVFRRRAQVPLGRKLAIAARVFLLPSTALPSPHDALEPSRDP